MARWLLVIYGIHGIVRERTLNLHGYIEWHECTLRNASEIARLCGARESERGRERLSSRENVCNKFEHLSGYITIYWRTRSQWTFQDVTWIASVCMWKYAYIGMWEYIRIRRIFMGDIERGRFTAGCYSCRTVTFKQYVCAACVGACAHKCEAIGQLISKLSSLVAVRWCSLSGGQRGNVIQTVFTDTYVYVRAISLSH